MRVAMISQKGMGIEPAVLSVIVTTVERPGIFYKLSKIVFYSRQSYYKLVKKANEK